MGRHSKADSSDTVPGIVASFEGKTPEEILAGLAEIAKMLEQTATEVCRLQGVNEHLEKVANHRHNILAELSWHIYRLGLPEDDPKATVITALEHLSKSIANRTSNDSRCS